MPTRLEMQNNHTASSRSPEAGEVSTCIENVIWVCPLPLIWSLSVATGVLSSGILPRRGRWRFPYGGADAPPDGGNVVILASLIDFWKSNYVRVRFGDIVYHEHVFLGS